jgi:hypothetical protein
MKVDLKKMSTILEETQVSYKENTSHLKSTKTT